VFDLATTTSKFLHLGLSLDQVIERVTQNPAEVMGISGEIGTLKDGAWGDAVVFDMEQGEFDFYDGHDQCRVGQQRIVPSTVVRAGSVYG